MKPGGATLLRAVSWWVRFLSLKIPFSGVRLILGDGPGLGLILDDSDVSRSRSWCDVQFGSVSQLFELSFLSAAPEGAATSWCREIALAHELSLEAGVVSTAAFGPRAVGGLAGEPTERAS